MQIPDKHSSLFRSNTSHHEMKLSDSNTSNLIITKR